MTASSEELAVYHDGAGWAAGPQMVYDRLAHVALAGLPARLDGTKGLDVGAGTGAATRELLRRGCDVVAVDMSAEMLLELGRQTGGRVPTLVGDIRKLALRDGRYDVVVAAYVLNHLDDPAAAVRELARVTRPSGQVIATTFAMDDHPIKAAIDEVLIRHGFVHPSWYRTLKRDRMPLTATPQALAAVGVAGGLNAVSVEEATVDLSDLPVEATVAYRLGLPHIASFVATLDEDARRRLDAELVNVVGALPPFWLPMLVLSGWC